MEIIIAVPEQERRRAPWVPRCPGSGGLCRLLTGKCPKCGREPETVGPFPPLATAAERLALKL